MTVDIYTMDKILRKVRKKEKEERWERRCLDVNICPICGGGTTRECWSDGGITHTCIKCNRKFEQ